jgi:hypothetical protein
MKTRLLYITLAFTFIVSGLAAQQTSKSKIHQVGINFSSLNSFGLHYKTGSEKTLLRLSLLAINLGSNSLWGKDRDTLEHRNQSYGAGFRLGFERQIPVVAKFNFIWGLEAGCNVNFQKEKREDYNINPYENTQWMISPLVNLILGAMYTFSDHFVVGAEITPGFQYSFGKAKYTHNSVTEEQTSSSFNFGFNSNSASISLAYRFGK